MDSRRRFQTFNNTLKKPSVCLILFSESVRHTNLPGITPQVRLLTTKPTRAGQAPKSRGIAFLEVPTSENMQAALKLHHTTLNSRRINVELTAGGGGKSDSRVGKIKERNERVDVQRVKRAEKEAAEGVESGAAAGAVGMGDERRQRQRPQRVWGAGAVEAAPAAPAQAQVQRDVAPAVAAPAEAPVQRAPKVQEDASFVQGVNDGTVKVRGGRRVKVAPNVSLDWEVLAYRSRPKAVIIVKAHDHPLDHAGNLPVPMPCLSDERAFHATESRAEEGLGVFRQNFLVPGGIFIPIARLGAS